MSVSYKLAKSCGAKVSLKTKVECFLHVVFEKDGQLDENKGYWKFAERGQLLSLTLNGESVDNLLVFAGHDWEMKRKPFFLPVWIVRDVPSGEKELSNQL